MKHIGFVTCSDLSRYFPSQKEALITHDDYLAFEYIKTKNLMVSPLVWGESPQKILAKKFDLLVIRSPWDYMDTKDKRELFMAWLADLENHSIKVINPIPLMLWNIDKHYLGDLRDCGIKIVPSTFMEPQDTWDLQSIWHQLGPFVIKPCISAAANDTYRLIEESLLENFTLGKKPYKKSFEEIRQGRSFIIQPYLKEIETQGEWSLVFLGEKYSHSVLKRPKPGHWLVQDELGGSVHWQTAPTPIQEAGIHVFSKLRKAYNLRRGHRTLKETQEITYARIDFIESKVGPLLSEIELIEPELFFLDRSGQQGKPYEKALNAFYHSILRSLKK